MNGGRQLHFVIDDALRGGRRRPGPARAVRVPDSPSFLRPGAPDARLVGRAGSAGSLVVEPLLDRPDPRLLVLTPPGAPAPTVNGRPAPRVCLLRVEDQLLLDDGRILHLTVFDAPRVATVGPDRGRQRCALCRTPLREGRRVYDCPCGASLHHDGAGVSDGLACATLSADCPSCRDEVRVEGGYRYVPDCD